MTEKYNRLFGSLLAYLVIFTFLPVLLMSMIGDANIVLIITMIVAFIPTLFSMGVPEFKHQLLQKRESLNPLFVILLALAPTGTNVIGGFIETGFKQIISVFGLSFTQTVAEMSQEITSMPTIQLALYTCIIAPVFEEFIFRNYLTRTIEKPRPILGIIVSGILFGLMHTNFDQSIGIIPTGIYFSYLAYRYSMWVPILAHVANNTIFFLAALFEGSKVVNFDSIMTVIAVVGMLSAIVVIISAVRYFIANRVDDKEVKPGYFKSPFLWVFIAYCIIMMFLNERVF